METERRMAYGALTLVLLLVAVQHVVQHEYGEPYPSLNLPTFAGGGMPITDTAETSELVFLLRSPGGGERPLSLEALFGPEMPDQTRAAIVAALYTPDRWSPVPENDHSIDISGGLFPGRAALWVHWFDRSAAYRSEPWLRSRIHDIYPDEHGGAVIVRWYTIRVALDHTERTLAYEGVIPLHEPGPSS